MNNYVGDPSKGRSGEVPAVGSVAGGGRYACIQSCTACQYVRN